MRRRVIANRSGSPGRLPLLLARITWYAVWLLLILLGLRFLLKMLAADPANVFASLVFDLTFVPLIPFFTLLPTPRWGPVSIELFTLIAMVMYLLVGTAAAKFFELFVPPERA